MFMKFEEFRDNRNRTMDAVPTNRTSKIPCSHNTYQYKAITSRSRQLLMMGTRLPKHVEQLLEEK